MEETRPILYGVADYAEIRKANAWFVDRTAKIRDLEATRYAVFLRPRRFGKSLLVSLLGYYYDVAFADRFAELFGGTDIGANPTEERGKYLALYFDFSAISKDVGKVQDDFDAYAGLCCDTFARRYAGSLPEGLPGRILAAKNITMKLNEIFLGMRDCSSKLYVFIDEYDNFTNTILAESGLNAYNELCHGDGFVKQFFTILKTATGGTNAPVTRLFITGVSPVTMDDVTSGFNIGTNISLMPQYVDLTGFRHDDLRAIADYYSPRCGFDAEKAYDTAIRWYDSYRFGDFSSPPIANTTIVLAFFNQLWQTKKFPKELIDENLRTDYAKIRHLLTLDRRLNGNFHVLENLIAGGELAERLVRSFQARELTRPENFTSLLYWLGITTITGDKRGKTVFGIPNETLKELAAKMIPAAYEDIHKIDERVFGLNDGLVDFSFDGNWRPFVGILSGIVKENFAVRDAVEGEKVVQSTLVALLTAAGGPYFVKHEREAGGGFYDIALEPQLLRWPDIAHAALIEMKYVKAGDPAPTPDDLAKIRSAATDQLNRYSSAPQLIAAWRLNTGTTGILPVADGGTGTTGILPVADDGTGTTGILPVADGGTGTTGILPVDGVNGQDARSPSSSVALHRLVLVFHGGACVLAEEV